MPSLVVHTGSTQFYALCSILFILPCGNFCTVLHLSAVHMQCVDLVAQLQYYNTPFVLGISLLPVRSMA